MFKYYKEKALRSYRLHFIVVSGLAGLLFAGCEGNHKPSSNSDTGISAVVGNDGRGGIPATGDVEEPQKTDNNQDGLGSVGGTGGAGNVDGAVAGIGGSTVGMADLDAAVAGIGGGMAGTADLDGAVAVTGGGGMGDASGQAGSGGDVAREVLAIGTGSKHACALMIDGAVVCWGSNMDNRVTAPSGSYTQLSTSAYHNCALRSDGGIDCWGRDDYGQATAPQGSYTQVSAGDSYSCAVRSDSTVSCWGMVTIATGPRSGDTYPVVVPEGVFTQVSAADCSSAIRTDGTIASFGATTLYSRQWLPFPCMPPVGAYTQVSGNCGVKVDGSLDCWGATDVSLPPSSGAIYTQVSSSEAIGDICALGADGVVDCWSPTFDDSQNVEYVLTPPALEGVYTQVSVAHGYSCALRSDGSIECWKGTHNTSSSTRMVSLSPSGPFKQVSVGRFGGFCAIKNDNTIGCSEGTSTSCFGNNFADLNESQVGIAQISVGSYSMSPHDCAIKTDGTVACWNDLEASWETSLPPGPYKQVSAKGNHTCAVKTDGTLVCWGYYYDFLAGNENGTIPVEPPPSGSSFVQVSTGFYHACALRSDGTIRCWHYNGESYQDFGQTVVPAGTYTQVGAGLNYTCALDDKGAIHCWGDNASGHTDVPDGTYTQLRANINTSCGLREDGAIVCWGRYFSSASELSGPYIDFDASDGALCTLTSNGNITCFSENADSEVTKSIILPGNL